MSGEPAAKNHSASSRILISRQIIRTRQAGVYRPSMFGLFSAVETCYSPVMNHTEDTRRRRGLTRLAIIVSIFVALGVTAIVGFHWWLNAAIKRAVEGVGSRMTRSTVTVETVSASIIPGRIQMSGLVLADLQGFRKPTAVKVEKTRISFDWTTVLADTIVIDEIVLDQPEFTYEGALGRKNLNTIPEKIETFAYTGSKDKGALPPPMPDHGLDTKVLVREFALTNGHVKWQGKEGPVTAVLPNIHLMEIAKQSGGAGVQEIASAIMDSIHSDVTRAVGRGDQLLDKGETEGPKSADEK